MNEQQIFEDQSESLSTTMKAWIEDGELIVPGLPDSVAEALRLANSPTATVAQIEKAIESDQSLTGQIMKVVNSPLYRGIKEIKSLKNAITFLGLQELRFLLYAALAKTTLFRSKKYSELMDALWGHSMAVAALSKLLAKLTGLDQDTAFLAGFLHDIGMASLLGTLSAKQKDEESPEPMMVEMAMRSVHEDAGKQVASSWNLSADIKEAIAYHHRFLKAEQDMELAACVQVANTIAHRYSLGIAPSLREKYEHTPEKYAPLKISYCESRTIDLPSFPPLEMLEGDNAALLARIEAELPALFTPATSSTAEKPQPPKKVATVARKEVVHAQKVAPERTGSSGAVWIAVITALAGLAVAGWIFREPLLAALGIGSG